MSDLDVLTEEFAKRLRAIPNTNTYSLEQWQYAYQKIILSMGLQIIEKFPAVVIGRDPSLSPPRATQGPPPPPPPPPPPSLPPPPIVIINGQPPPYHTFSQQPPYHVLVVASVALSDCPDCPKK
jgi:hypothetical protein